MASVACFTSFSYGYLARARVLAETVRRLHPDWSIWALITDQPPAGLDPAALAPFHHMIESETLGIAGFRGWIFKHDVVEACTAVKAAMLRHLLGLGAGKVIYLDPDIALFAPLDPIIARLDRASIVLTPHQTAANDTALAIGDNERGSMRFGIFNLGFLGVRNDRTGRAFAEWWAGRLHEACYDEPEEGLFTDQKYCDLVPGLFAGVHIERDPGCNVASWNISRRSVTIGRDGSLLADGQVLRFYHFTKIGGVGDVMTERYAGETIAIYELVAWYMRALRREAMAGLERHGWHYGRFSDGSPVPRAARLLLRRRADLAAAFADPFQAGDGGYRAWLARHQPQILSETPPARN